MPGKKSSTAKSIKERGARPVEDLSFEDAFRELEEIVAQLESDDLPLEESLALYERGQRLAARCNVQLDTAELRVQQLERGELVPLTVENDRST